ncbi:uncharacterized protein LOC117178028 [Belonocnema kinseyi]|uniref:uncharacterized protein LOC117178028 n=1 Tax=Belonocnema kinseyi TaxID=2817044 RepID=UPI00143D2274|nr:uncharacterized protein LOC117178028 [Belonocnema kinseyi]
MSLKTRVKKENALRKDVTKIKRTHDVVLPFYPNECFVCKSTNQLKICGRCNMVSYCSSDHQKEHWPRHKDICNVISSILTEKGVSHVYENLRGIDSSKWRQAKINLMSLIAKKLSRPITVEDSDIVAFPRVCFACYDAIQENLRNCPACPFASFCEEHRSSSLHDEDCIKIREFQVQEVSRMKNLDVKLEHATFKRIVEGTPFCENLQPPSSITEYFEDYIKLPLKLYKELKIHISYYLSAPLSIFSAIQKMNLEIGSALVLHLIDSPLSLNDSKPWEILLHLLPKIQNLKIVLVNSEFRPGCTSKTTEIALCKDCKFRNKTLVVDVNVSTYGDYKNYRYYQQPDILVNFDVTITCGRVESNKGVASDLDWKKLSCPIVFLSSSEIEASSIESTFQSDSEFSQVYYNGRNNFQSLKFSRNLKSLCADLKNQFIIVFKRLPKMNVSKNCFYPSVCPVCSSKALIVCEFCKMIFYCGFEHLKEHQSLHKDFCDAVQRLLTETGASNPFDNLEKGDPESWLRAKIDLMYKVQLKLGKERQLTKCEEQMFLYTKTCLICHSGDLSNLTTCECGISLCEKHTDNLRHQQLCRDLLLSFKLSTTMIRADLDVLVKPFIRERTDILPSSMDSFIDSCLSLNKEASQGKNKPNTPDIQKIMLSDLLSRPLTFLYALQKLNLKVEKTMVVHVICAMDTDYSETHYWDFALYWLRTLRTLKMIFIGPKMCPVNGDDVSRTFKYMKSRSYFGRLGVEIKQERYDEYFQDPSFEKPDIILGYDLDLQEMYGISNNSKCPWKETIITLAKLEVPFVLTAGTKEQALKDHEKICSVLGKSINFALSERNPFASLFPRRHVLFQSLRHSNDYIIIYTNWSKNLIKRPRLKSSGGDTKLAASAKFESNKSRTGGTIEKNPVGESKRRENLESSLKQPASKKIKTDTGFEIKPSQFKTIPRDTNPLNPTGPKNIGCKVKPREGLEFNLKAEETDKLCDEIEWQFVKRSPKKERMQKKDLLDLVKSGQEKKKVHRIVARTSKISQVDKLKNETKLSDAKNFERNQNKAKLANGKKQGVRNRKETRLVSVKNPGPVRTLLQNARYKSKLESPKLQKMVISGMKKLSESAKKPIKEKVNKKELSSIEKIGEENRRFLGKFATKLNPFKVKNIKCETKPDNSKNGQTNQDKTKLAAAENYRCEIANLKTKQTDKEAVGCEIIFRENFESAPKAAVTDQEIKQAAVEKVESKMKSSQMKDMGLKMQKTMSNLFDKTENQLQNRIFSATVNIGFENEEYEHERVEYKPKSVLVVDYKSEMNSVVKRMESKTNLDYQLEINYFEIKRTADKETFGFQTRRTGNLELKSNTDVESNSLKNPNKKENLLRNELSDVGKIGHETENLENDKFNLKLEKKFIETNFNLSSSLDSTLRMDISNAQTKLNGKENLECEAKLTENLESKSKLITKESDKEKCVDDRKLSQTEISFNKTFTIHKFESSLSIEVANSESQLVGLKTGCVARITEICRSLFILFMLICIWILMHLKLKYEDFIDYFMNQKQETAVENFDFEIDESVASVESTVNLNNTQNSSSGEFEVAPLNFQNGDFGNKLGDSVECEEQVRAKKSSNFKAKSRSFNRKLPEEKFFCRETHELLMEKLLFEEKMNHFANEKLYLRQECERVEQENVLINDIRLQINEGITAEFQDED